MKKEKKKVTKKKKVKKEKKTFFNPFKAVFVLFKEEGKELKKVSWPTKKTMAKNFVATVFTVVFLGILFYTIDIIMAWLKTVVM